MAQGSRYKDLPKRIKIGNKYVGEGEPCFIIAEAGINHNGDVEIAKQLIKAAKECGADAVKFQKRSTEDILTRVALKKPYDSPNAFAATYGEHRKKLELPESAWQELKNFSDNEGIIFFASAWDKKSADFLETLNLPAYKVASADLTNLPLLEHIAKKGKPVILSTGMSVLEEVDEAVETILKHNKELILMHCVSDYPCDNDKVNLRVMNFLKDRYEAIVGYSGHESGVAIPIAAMAMGAAVIEKHFTLNRAAKGSDHAASLEADGLRMLVKFIKNNIEPALGDGIKRITDMEKKMRVKLAKSIVSVSAIPKGTLIKAEMLTVKGPGDGLKPNLIPKIVGKWAKSDIPEDSILTNDQIIWEA